MNVPTALSTTEIQAWRRRVSLNRRMTLRGSLGSAVVYGFGIFLFCVGATRLIGGAR
jgi:hypothetical protein